MTVSESGGWGGYWQRSGDQSLIRTSARHQSCAETWKHSQSLRLREFECSSKTKPQVIHYLTASFSAIYFLWKSKKNKKIRNKSVATE